MAGKVRPRNFLGPGDRLALATPRPPLGVVWTRAWPCVLVSAGLFVGQKRGQMYFSLPPDLRWKGGLF